MPSLSLARQRFGDFSMYAIVKTGGKQFKAAKDEILIVEKLEGEAGAKIELNEVVMVCDGEDVKVGSPFIKGASVKTEIIRQTKGPKIEGFNYKPKKNERKRWGHRQPQTHLRVVDVIPGK
jgi:large subunit ribosomal protein L21